MPAPDGGQALVISAGVDVQALMKLAQWLSPAFPIGGFAWSGGLESAIEGGDVTARTLPGWIGDVLQWGTGWTDAVLLALALRPHADHAALDDLARALCLSSQRLAETVEQGTAFAATLAALPHPAAQVPLTGAPCVPDDPSGPPARARARARAMAVPAGQGWALPVAVGRAAAGLGLPARLVIALFVQAQAANMIHAAVRYLPLGQTAGQRMLADLHPLIADVAARAAGAGADDLATATPGADAAALAHETLHTRIFRS